MRCSSFLLTTALLTCCYSFSAAAVPTTTTDVWYFFTNFMFNKKHPLRIDLKGFIFSFFFQKRASRNMPLNTTP